MYTRKHVSMRSATAAPHAAFTCSLALRPREKRQFSTTCTSHVKRQTSNVKRHTSHVTRHPSITVISFSSYKSMVSNSSCSGTCSEPRMIDMKNGNGCED